MKQQQKETLTVLAYQLRNSINDKSESYNHTSYENGQEKTYEINREQHLEIILKWALQELENNFELSIE